MTKKYQDTSNGELAKLLSEKREALRALRFSSAGSRPKDSSEPARLRKEIARMMTEFSARSIKNRLTQTAAISEESASDKMTSDATN